MKTFLNSLNHVEKIDVKDIIINIYSYNIIDINNYSVDEQVFYKEKSTGKIKRQSASDYTYNLLKKGYAVYFENTVYYMPTLDNKNCLHFKLDKLNKEINRVLQYRNNSKYTFTDYLINSRDFSIIKSYIQMYEHGLVSLEWVKNKMEGKINNINKVIEKDLLKVV